MTNLLITVLAALTVIVIIVILGLLLTQLIIRRTEKVQMHNSVILEQAEVVVIDIDELSETRREPGITVISNDVTEDESNHHRLRQNTLSVIDSEAQIDPIRDQTIEIEQKRLTIPTRNASSSDLSRINALTDKITLPEEIFL